MIRKKGLSIPSTHGIGRSFSYRCTRKALVDAILIMLLCKSVYFTEYRRKPKYPVAAKIQQPNSENVDIFADDMVYYVID